MASTPIQKLNPYRSFKEWGLVQIGPMVLPGVLLSIDGAEKPEKWLVQMGIAVSNAVTVWRGTQLAEAITLRMNLPDEASFDSYYDVQTLLRPKLGARPPSLAIVNAIINFVGITRISNVSVKPPKLAQGLSWVGEIVLIEYRPPKIAAVGPADPPKAKSENDLLADQVVGLVAEAKRVSQ